MCWKVSYKGVIIHPSVFGINQTYAVGELLAGLITHIPLGQIILLLPKSIPKTT